MFRFLVVLLVLAVAPACGPLPTIGVPPDPSSANDVTQANDKDPADQDGDKIPDISDNCISVKNNNQADGDKDGVGDACDSDKNNDGISDTAKTDCLAAVGDTSPRIDTDGDGICDSVDTDDDGDLWTDTEEIACGTNPLQKASKPFDANHDWICDSLEVSHDPRLMPDTIPACMEETFLDLSKTAGAGPSYPMPQTAISCTASLMTVESNDIPHYTYEPMGPGTLTAQDLFWRVPIVPAWSDTVIPFAINSEIGVAVNGATILTPSEAEDLHYGDPVFEEILDSCEGHINPQGYHYHSMEPTCFFSEDTGTTRSPIIAWAFDGYPIYGHYDCATTGCGTMVEMKSSYVQIKSPTECAANSYEYVGDADLDEAMDGDDKLDRCNGHFGPRGDYHYHVTTGYPYILGCFHGTPSVSGRAFGATPADAHYTSVCSTGTYISSGGGGTFVDCTTLGSTAECSGQCTYGTGCVCASGPTSNPKICVATCNTSNDCTGTETCMGDHTCRPPPP